MHPIQRACDVVGSQRLLAAGLGVTPGAISQWISGLRAVPAERCPDIERLTAGAVRCEDLRPDIPWGVLRATDCPGQCDQEKQAA